MKNKGFTIIELMLTVALLGVIMAIGVPSFTGTIRDNRMTASLNEFIASIKFSHAEAVARRTDVTICKSASPQTSCAASGDWAQGWLVFVDEDADGVVDTADDEILQVHRALHSSLTLTGSANLANRLTVDARGFARAFSGDFTLCDQRGAADAKGILVSVTTRIARTVDSDSDGTENTLSGELSCP